ncbi:MAG: DUF1573 domain-containing protein [Chloroherpetonaceae bacterium]|nr:DUF1573 domain-containing protein [Chloroherpetonaceae bacterium]
MKLSKLISLFVAFSCFKGVSIVAQPILEVSPKEVDLGTIYLGKAASLSFEIRNVGNETLKILKLTPSCGCTAAELPKDSLRPAESQQVSLSFDPTGFLGEVKKTVGIYANSREKYSQFSFYAKVSTDLDYIGGGMSAWAGRIKKGENKTIKIEMANRAGYPIKVKSIQSNSPELKFTLPKSANVLASESFVFEVKIQGTGEEFSQALLTIETDNPRQPLVPLRLTFIGE